jgi:hypothetical protein
MARRLARSCSDIHGLFKNLRSIVGLEILLRCNLNWTPESFFEFASKGRLQRVYAACSRLKSNDQVDIAILCIGAAGNGTKHADALQRVLAREAIPMLVKVRENLCSP